MDGDTGPIEHRRPCSHSCGIVAGGSGCGRHAGESHEGTRYGERNEDSCARGEA